MKKKITALFLLLCLICGVMACGGEEEKKEEKKSKKNKAALVTVNGEDYDLSKDFKDVVGDMVKAEIKVASLTSYRYFDEKGHPGCRIVRMFLHGRRIVPGLLLRKR